MSSTYAPHIVFAGGGTGGHLLPGLNIANHVARRIPSANLTFIGTGKPMERHTVREAGHSYIAIPACPAPSSPLEAFRFLTDNVAGYWSARWLLRDQKASLVVGLGGLASGAAVRTAAARGLPTVLLEQNAIPSRTTRWLASGVSVICSGFEQISERLPAGANVQIVGNAVRPALESSTARVGQRGALPQPKGSARRLVVLGGNLGANALNRVVPSALSRVREQLHGWAIVHQAGVGRTDETQRRYEEAGVDALVVGLLDADAEVIAESDLVVSRSCGTTLAELALVGAAAIVIPFPEAADDHQMVNARIFADAGACRLVDEETAGNRLDVELSGQLGALLADDASRGEMSAAMRQFAHPRAAADIADIITDLAEGRTALAA